MWIRLALVLTCCSAGPLCADHLVVLRSGFTLHASSYETQDGLLRLRTTTGTIEMPLAELQEVQTYDPPEAEGNDASAGAESQPPPAPLPVDPKALLDEYAAHFGLPPAFLRSVARVESGFRQEAVSPKGALGVMQLMPATAAALAVDPTDLRGNVHGGAKYLTELLLRYQNFPDQVRRALAAYNAGPAAVDKYNGIPPYPETMRYVNRVLSEYRRSLPRAFAE